MNEINAIIKESSGGGAYADFVGFQNAAINSDKDDDKISRISGKREGPNIFESIMSFKNVTVDS